MRRFKKLLEDTAGLTPRECYDVVARFITDYPNYKEALRFMYEPNIKFYIKVTTDELYSSLYKCKDEPIKPNGESLDDMMSILISLHTRELKGNKAKEVVWDYALNVNVYILFWLYGRMDNGFGVSSARKLGIISAHSPQKGILVSDLGRVPYPIIADVKYNGIRCTVYNDAVTGCECKLLRGQVKEIPKLEAQIRAELPTGWCYDGELIYGNGITEEDRLLVSRLMNQKGVIDLIDGYAFVIYDMIPIDNFKTGKPYRVPFHERRKALLEAMDNTTPKTNGGLITPAQSFQIENSTVLIALMGQIKSHNGEGVMLKPLHSTYDFKKNKQWYKLKTYKEASLQIMDFREHTRNGAWLGSLRCEGVVEGKPVSVWVGSGLNDNDRDINLYSKVYEGAIVEVVFMDIVKDDATGKYSLTNPRFNKPNTHTLLKDIIRQDAGNINY